MLYLELKHRLPEFLLTRIDKIGMANSIEVRVPFLDYRIIELAFNIPFALKIKDGIHKYILKKASEKILSREILYREKMGFCGSTIQMLTYNLKTFAKNYILEEIKNLPGFFKEKYILSMLND